MRWRGGKFLGLKQVPAVEYICSPEEEKELALRDNVHNGVFDVELLSALYSDEELKEWGVDMGQFGVFEEKEVEVKPDIPFSEELNEENNYIVLKFDNNIDWLQAQTLLELKTEKALDSKEGFEKMGVGRVLNGFDVIKKLQK